MTDQQPTAADDAAPEPAATDSTPDPGPFARLTDELAELGFDGAVNDLTGFTTFTATDSPVRVALDDSGRPSRAVFVRDCGGEEGWEITFTAAMPEPAQLVVLYAALNADDPATATRAAAAALGVTIAT